VAEGVCDGERGEGGGGGCGCADNDAGGDLAVGRPVRGDISAGTIVRQVGEQHRQFFPGAGGQGVPGSLVELVGCDPAGLEGFGQLAECPVAIRVADPQVADRVVPYGRVHGTSVSRRARAQ
jgi:hypothetical protein